MTVTVMGSCCRVGCDETIVAVEHGSAFFIRDHACKGKLYTTKKRIYDDGH